MTQFLLLYRGPQMDMSAATPELGAAVMDDWNAWMGRVGVDLTDGGNPVVAHVNVRAGSEGTPTDVNGYSIIEARDLDAARALLTDHPHLADPRNSIDILEVTPLPQM